MRDGGYDEKIIIRILFDLISIKTTAPADGGYESLAAQQIRVDSEPWTFDDTYESVEWKNPHRL